MKSKIRVVAVVVALMIVAAACSSDHTAHSSETVDRQAGAGVALKVVSGAFEAYKRINACLENKKVGQPCLASDASNIRATLKEVKELRAQVERNQTQVMAEFDSIRALIRDQNVRQLSDQLRSMVINTGEAGKAYEALSVCAATTESTCWPYIGRAGDPVEPVKQAIEKTEAYFNEAAGNLPQDLPVTASWFTGMSPSYENGLADAIWMFNKGNQDTAAGVTNSAVKDSRTVPILTEGLVNAENRELAYWGDIFGEYGFMAVQYAGFGGDAMAAERRQAQADTWILDEASRGSVNGTINHYALPGLALPGAVVVADAGKAWLIANRTMTNSRPLTSDDVALLADAINGYSTVAGFQNVPNALPAGGWYSTRASIERVRYNLYRYVVDRDYGGVADAIWLIEPSPSAPWCSTRVRPTDAPVARPSNAITNDRGPVTADPSMVPSDRLLKTWERFAKDKSIAFDWHVRDLGSVTAGWGAWIKCESMTFTGSIVQLLKVPPLMQPAN